MSQDAGTNFARGPPDTRAGGSGVFHRDGSQGARGPWGTAAKPSHLPRPRPPDRESPGRATRDNARRSAAFPAEPRWLKKKHKHVSPACAQPPVGVEGSRALHAVGPAAKLPKAGACRGLSSLSGSTCRRGRSGPTAKRLGPGST